MARRTISTSPAIPAAVIHPARVSPDPPLLLWVCCERMRSRYLWAMCVHG